MDNSALDAPKLDRGDVRWISDECPANWRTHRHELGEYGKCLHCHERPTVERAS